MDSEGNIFESTTNNDNNDSTKQMLGWIGSLLAVFLFTSPIRDIFGKNGVYYNKNTNNLATCLLLFIIYIYIKRIKEIVIIYILFQLL